jgi:hypothetical protein
VTRKAKSKTPGTPVNRQETIRQIYNIDDRDLACEFIDQLTDDLDGARWISPELLIEIPHPGVGWILGVASFGSSLSCSCLVGSEPVAVPVDADYDGFV